MGADGANSTVTRGDCSFVGELLPSTHEFLGSECKRGWGGGMWSGSMFPVDQQGNRCTQLAPELYREVQLPDSRAASERSAQQAPSQARK